MTAQRDRGGVCSPRPCSMAAGAVPPFPAHHSDGRKVQPMLGKPGGRAYDRFLLK